MAFVYDHALRQRIAENLDAFPERLIEGEDLRSAAVVIAVTTDPGGTPAIILTRRPARMGRHAGQYALPGGKVDPGETAAQAAFRELSEELGLDLPQEALLGRLDDYATRSGFRISPFVVWAGASPEITPQPDEVAAVHFIPFDDLVSDAIPLFDPGETPERPVLFSRFPSLGTTLYSPTGSLVYQFREVAILGQPTRVAHFDQPRFAWR